LTEPSPWNGVTMAVSSPSYGRMGDSFARRPVERGANANLKRV
jgi:hypothetical protein